MGLSHETLELAARQGGVVTRSQLLELHHKPGGIDWMVRSGTLSPIVGGAYRLLPASGAIDLVRGAVATLPGAVVSHQSAAYLLHFPRLPEQVATVTVESHTTHEFPGVTVRRCDDLTDQDVMRVDGLPCTSVPRTLFDLARLLSDREFDAIGEALLIAERLVLEQFIAATDRLARQGKGGSRNAKRFIDRRVGHPGTVLERLGREAIVAAGLPLPIPELPIPWLRSSRFDDAYPELRVAIEWDSRAWHLQRAAMRSDRQRDREAAAHNWILLRFTWEDVTERPAEVAAAIAQVLSQRSV